MARIGRLTRLFRIRDVTVSVHWSVLVIGALVLLSAWQRPIVTTCALVCYLTVLLIHEYGHAREAWRRGCTVYSIELYPLHGITRFSQPSSPYDASAIAWGGVTAQLVLAVPLMAWVGLFGYSRFEAANAAFALLGFFSAGIAAMNLLPIPRLDGSLAWYLIPLMWHRWRTRRRARRSEERPRQWIH